MGFFFLINLFSGVGSSLSHRLFSSCSEQGILSWLLRAVLSLASEHRLWSTGPSRAAAPGLQSTDSIAVLPGLSCSVGSSWARGQTRVSYTGRRILYQCVSREALGLVFFFNIFLNKMFIYLTLLGLSCGMQDL